MVVEYVSCEKKETLFVTTWKPGNSHFGIGSFLLLWLWIKKHHTEILRTWNYKSISIVKSSRSVGQGLYLAVKPYTDTERQDWFCFNDFGWTNITRKYKRRGTNNLSLNREERWKCWARLVLAVKPYTQTLQTSMHTPSGKNYQSVEGFEPGISGL